MLKADIQSPRLQLGILFKKVTTYYVDNNTLYKSSYTVTGRNGISVSNGIVTTQLLNTGTIVLESAVSTDASLCISSATLKSAYGTNVSTANSSGAASSGFNHYGKPNNQKPERQSWEHGGQLLL